MIDLIVLLDLSDMDSVLLEQIHKMDQTLSIGEICLVHYIPIQEGGELYRHLPELDEPLEGIIRREFLEMVENKHIDSSRCTIEIFSSGGFGALVEWIDQGKYDVCVIGKKAFSTGSGVFSGKLARRINKSVLFLSELIRPQVEKILVPLDYTHYSKAALEFAFEVNEELKCEICALNIFRVHPTYFPYLGEMSEKSVERLFTTKKNKLNSYCKKFIEGQHIQTEVVTTERNVGEEIYHFARNNFMDLIILGIKGKTDDDMLLIGSVAHYLIQSDIEVSVLLIRPMADK